MRDCSLQLIANRLGADGEALVIRRIERGTVGRTSSCADRHASGCSRVLNTLPAVCCLLAMTVSSAWAQIPADTDAGWPQEVDARGFHLMIYQPQVDQWKKNHLEARAAVTVTREGSPAPLYGIVSLTARTDVDKESRMVRLEDVKATSVSFPATKSKESELERAIRDTLPQWPHTVALDRLLADLAMTQAEGENESVAVKNDPPKILYSPTPAVLIVVDGQPVLRSVQGTPFQHAINTPATLFYDTSASRYYLDGNGIWVTATTLDGPWTAATNSPAGLDQAKTQIEQTEEKDPHDHSKDPGPPPMSRSLPAVFVSTAPAELLVTQGAPQLSPISKTKLLYVTNTENNIFLDVPTQNYYVLLSGRWYQGRSLKGPWTWVSGSQLPGDFSKIPSDSPKASVLASVPGTQQAREAVIANQIPQTAAVRRAEASIEVRYDGAPQFRPIEGTSLEYAVNTANDVIHARSRYYACHNGVRWPTRFRRRSIRFRRAVRYSTTAMSMCTARLPMWCISDIRPDISARTCMTVSSYSAPAGFIPPGLATIGSAGPGRGASDSTSATGVADGSGGRWVVTGGITTPGTRIASTANTGIPNGIPAMRSGFITTQTSTTVGKAMPS